MAGNVPIEIRAVPFSDEFASRCARLEARAFNRLRTAWGQPLQAPRSVQWLRHFARENPRGGQVAFRGNQPIGYCLVQVWGRLGWLGPVAVHPTDQGQGIGSRLVTWGRDRLLELGCDTVALETWPHNLSNIALYLKAGFDPGPLILVFETALADGPLATTAGSLGSWENGEGRLRRLRDLAESIAPGLDYGPLFQATLACSLGEVLLWEDGGEAQAAAVLHYRSHQQAPPPSSANLEMLVIRPGEEHRLEGIVEELESRARQAGKSGLRISLSSHHVQGVRFFLKRGYRIRKSRLRMYHCGGLVAPEKVDYLSYVV